MALNVLTLSAAKKYLAKVVAGIKSYSVDGLTLNIITNDGTRLSMTFPKPADGKDGAKGDKGDTGERGLQGERGLPFTYADFTQEQLNALKVKGDKGDNGANGADGFSPTIAIKKNTSNEYVLSITNKSGSFDTPNLKTTGNQFNVDDLTESDIEKLRERLGVYNTTQDVIQSNDIVVQSVNSDSVVLSSESNNITKINDEELLWQM